MDQIKTGKFIAGLRKEKGLTQAQLAEKLNITDRAISKWETGKSMPDSSIMLELCSILGITVNELLSGERIEMNNFEEKANENLLELKRKDEKNFKLNTVISIIYTVVMLTSIVICGICDFSISGSFTWSPITFAAIIYAWLISIPMIYLGKRGIIWSLISTSIFTIPFLYALSSIIHVKALFSIGAVMAVIALVYLWIVYYLFTRFQSRRFLACGITIMIAIVLCIIINIILSCMLNTPIFDIWDALSGLLLLIVGIILICFDATKRKQVHL